MRYVGHDEANGILYNRKGERLLQPLALSSPGCCQYLADNSAIQNNILIFQQIPALSSLAYKYLWQIIIKHHHHCRIKLYYKIILPIFENWKKLSPLFISHF